jgi:serine/threonine protein kinase
MMSTIDETDEPSLTFSELNQEENLFYESRFLEDFQPVSLLGRGAFGRVFEARKLIDQKHYAIKRIKLPSNKEARAKVMREVTVI